MKLYATSGFAADPCRFIDSVHRAPLAAVLMSQAAAP